MKIAVVAVAVGKAKGAVGEAIGEYEQPAHGALLRCRPPDGSVV